MKIGNLFLLVTFVCFICWYVFSELRQGREDVRLSAALGLRRTLASWMFSWAGFYQWTGEVAGARLRIDRFYGTWDVGWIWRISITLPPRHAITTNLYALKNALLNRPYSTFWPQFNRPLSTVFGRLRRCPSPPKWGDRWFVYIDPTPHGATVLDAAGELDPNEWDIIELEKGSLRCEKLAQLFPASSQDFVATVDAARRLDSALGT